MKLEYEVAIEPDCVLLTCTGLATVDRVVEAFERAAELARAEKSRAALVDIRGTQFEQPGTLERFDLGTRTAELLRRHHVRLAVVGDEPTVDPARFGETVAVNRGAMMRVFTDLESARRWLM